MYYCFDPERLDLLAKVLEDKKIKEFLEDLHKKALKIIRNVKCIYISFYDASDVYDPEAEQENILTLTICAKLRHGLIVQVLIEEEIRYQTEIIKSLDILPEKVSIRVELYEMK